MSYVMMPDPFPGRCPNFRQNGPPNFDSRRCVEREDDIRHVCRFDPPRAQVPAAALVGSYSYQRIERKPWVAPPPTKDGTE